MEPWILFGVLGAGVALASILDGDNSDSDPVANSGDDRISGAAEAELIDAGAGDDTITDFGGSDTVLGGDGDDYIHGSSGTQSDFVDAGAGDDTVRYVGDNSTVLGGAGNDLLSHLGETGAGLSVAGGVGNDTLVGSGQLTGGEGDDVLIHRLGDSTLSGGEGADVFATVDVEREGQAVVTDFNPAEDRIVLDGVTEADLDGGLVRMTVVCNQDGQPELVLGDQSNPLIVLQNVAELTPESFPQGFDLEGVSLTLTGGDDSFHLGGIAGGQNLGDWEHLLADEITGGHGNDWIDAGDASGPLGGLTLNGNAGNDSIIGGRGADLIDGGTGDDWIRDADNGYLFDGADTPLGDADDTIHGGAGNDNIRTGAGNDLVFGGDGNDILSDDFVTQDLGQGRYATFAEGAATLDGGAGDDTLIVNDGDVATLGEGADEVILTIDNAVQPDAAAVTVTDFRSGEDRIYLHYYAPEGTELPTLRSWAAADGSGLNVGFEGSDDPIAVLQGVTQLSDGDLSLHLVDPSMRSPS